MMKNHLTNKTQIGDQATLDSFTAQHLTKRMDGRRGDGVGLVLHGHGERTQDGRGGRFELQK